MKTLADKVKNYKTSIWYEIASKQVQNNSTGIYNWTIYGEDENCDFGGHHHMPHIGDFQGTLEQAIEYAVMLPKFYTWGGGGNIRLTNPPVKAEEPKPKAKPYMVLPPTARKFCWNYDGVIIGGYVKFLLGEAESAKDLDIIIPLHKWPEACRLVPTGSKSNCFGGFKFREGNIEVDVWPGDALQTLREQYPKGIKAYCPKTSLVIKLEVV